jgi:adhesin transport system membrane fusion protein
MRRALPVLFLGSIIAFLVIMAATAKIEISAAAEGVVIPSGKVRTVQNLEGGILKEIHVAEGQLVAAGDALMTLEQIVSRSEVGEIQTRLAFLSTQITLYEALVSEKKPRFDENLRKTNSEIVRAGVKQYQLLKESMKTEEQFSAERQKGFQNQILNIQKKIEEKKLELDLVNNQMVTNEEGFQNQILNIQKKIEEKRGELSLIARQISTSEEGLESQIANIKKKTLEKEQELELIQSQIVISEDLLKQQITSQLAHLDLKRQEQRTKSDLASLVEQVDRVGADIDDKKLELARQEQRIKSDLASFTEQADRIKADIRVNKVELSRQEQRIKSDLASFEEQLDRRVSDIKENDVELRLKLEQIIKEFNDRLQTFIEEKEKYTKRLSRFQDQLSRTKIVSPISGKVQKIHIVTVGGVVRPGVDLVEVVPTEETLVVEAKLRIDDVGFVKTGQRVLLRLKGEAGRQFEPLVGTLSMISPDAVKPDGVEKGYYLIKISSNETVFSSGKRDYKMSPGVALDCNIIIGYRSVLDNLLAPFLDVKNKSFRERVWVDASIQNQWINHFSNIFDPGKWVPQTK